MSEVRCKDCGLNFASEAELLEHYTRVLGEPLWHQKPEITATELVKRYKIGFRVEQDGALNLLWDGGELVNLNEVLAAIQTVIDQLGDKHAEWRNGAVLAYNAISASQSQSSVCQCGHSDASHERYRGKCDFSNAIGHCECPGFTAQREAK